MKKLILIILFLSIGIRQTHAQSDNPEVDLLIESFMKKWDLPGCSFALSFNGNVIYSKGYGFANVKSGEPVTVTSLFRIASCTKPITAAAIMKLAEDGKLDLKDKVFGNNGILNLPEYQKIKDKRVLEITVADLLQHTGGWGPKPDPMTMSLQIANSEGVKPPAMQDAIIKFVLSKMDLASAPGTAFAYSNFGYCVLGRVIEEVTGISYEDYVKDNILHPSGIISMELGKNLESEKFNDEVTYYDTKGMLTTTSVYGDGKTVPWAYGGFNIEAMDSNGEWIASSEDLLNFLKALGDNKLINENSYQVMTTSSGVKNSAYAKGWYTNGGTIFHTGSLPGSYSEVVKAVNGYSWALLFNKRDKSREFASEADVLGWKIQELLK